MDLKHLQDLKNKIEVIKSEKARCSGQEEQLEIQKQELLKQFKELNVTKDTLPGTIEQLEKDIATAESDIDLVLKGLGNKYDTFR